MTMRDAFFYRIFEKAKQSPDIVVLTSDFSAPSFDRFRTELPGQFINTGISEQNTMLVAAGLAHSGKKVFVTSIAPFIVMRCYEQTRLYAADMNFDVKIVAVGAGFSYNTSGPTHHAVEDISLMRALPNMNVIMPCGNNQVEGAAEWCVSSKSPAYIRLDRMNLNELYDNSFYVDDAGFNVWKNTDNIMFLASGYMTHTAVKIVKMLNDKGIDAGIIDLYKIPVDKTALVDSIKHVKKLVTIEEHVRSGGIGSYINELLVDSNCHLSLKCFALDFSKGLYHRYGTRDEIHEACGIGKESILRSLEGLL